MKVNLKILSTFLAVAENRSFRLAAEQLHVSVPAVSMQVKQLENRLGVALLQRTTRKVELTREGEQLMISARRAMAEVDAALMAIQQAANAQQGQLMFACVPTVAGSRLPALLTDFARSYPRISVGVRELAQPELLEAVRRREVDFGIGPVAARPGELLFEPLFTEEIIALLPPLHPSVRRDGISLRELSGWPLLALGASDFRKQLEAALEAEGLTPELNYEFTHASTMVAMVEAGLGVAILPAVAVPRNSPLTSVRISRPAMTRTIAVVTIRGHTLSPAAARFVEMCSALAPVRSKPGRA